MRSKALSLPLVFAVALALPLAGCSKSQPAPSTAATPTAQPGTAAGTQAENRAEPRPEGKKEGKRHGKKEAQGESTTALGLRVRLELLQKLGVDGLRVDVTSNGGKVMLAGEVKQRATAELAEQVAGKVEGVASVESKIQVATGAESGTKVDRALAETEAELADAALETRVRIALVDKMGSDGLRIGTEAASGVLTLEFPKKMKKARRQEALALAKKVEGVKKVVSLDKG